jgi:hypothetical protein
VSSNTKQNTSKTDNYSKQLCDLKEKNPTVLEDITKIARNNYK